MSEEHEKIKKLEVGARLQIASRLIGRLLPEAVAAGLKYDDDEAVIWVFRAALTLRTYASASAASSLRDTIITIAEQGAGRVVSVEADSRALIASILFSAHPAEFSDEFSDEFWTESAASEQMASSMMNATRVGGSARSLIAMQADMRVSARQDADWSKMRLWPAVSGSDELTSRDIWLQLKRELLNRDGRGWSVWTDWYDAWLEGRKQFPQFSPQAREALEIGLCLIPDADWKQGPAHVNAIIRRMIDEALAEAGEDSADEVGAGEPAPPPQEPSSLAPIWIDGVLTQSRASPVHSDDQALLVASLIALREEIGQLALDFDAWSADCVLRRNEAPQVTLGPLRQLRALAALIGDEAPTLQILFRILHASESVRGQIALVKEQWPDDLAVRYASIANQFDAPARLSPDWRKLVSSPNRPEPEAVRAAPDAVDALAESFEKLDDPVVDRSLVDGMRDIAQRLRQDIAEGAAAATLRARDLIEGVNNILKRLAEAGLAIYDSKLGKRTRREFASGFRAELPIQAKRLGKTLAKVVIWGPIAVCGSALAVYFEWLPPFWRLFGRFLK